MFCLLAEINILLLLSTAVNTHRRHLTYSAWQMMLVLPSHRG